MTNTIYSPSRRASSARQYAKVGLESQVLGARPEQLISLLFQGARTAIKKAQFHLQRQETSQRGAMVSKAVNIVDSGLKAAVDKDVGGEVSEHLIASYELIVYHLLQGNLKEDSKHLETAEIMLKNLHEAWNEAVSVTHKHTSTD